MFYELSNNPTVPVSLSDAKAFLRVDTTADDALITYLIEASVEWGEGYCNRDFRVKDWIGYYSTLCLTNSEPYPFVELSKSPINSVDAVDISVNGLYTATTQFIRKRQNSYDRILFTGTPLLDDSVGYTFKVTFSSGYSSLPNGLKTAILEHVSFLYENRADAPSEPPEQIKKLYHRFRNYAGYA